MKKIYALALASVLHFTLANAQTFKDNFENYNLDWLGPQSAKWTTWSGNEGSSGSDDVKVSDIDAASGSNSLYFPSGAGPQDVVLMFGGEHNKGHFVFSQNMKVPSSKGAYFNFQADSIVAKRWAVEVTFGTTGSVTFSNTSNSNMLTISYPQGRWFEIKIQINFAINRWEVFIDNESKGYFSNSINQVASLDLYPINSSSTFWVDDVYYKYYPLGPNDAGVVSIDSPAVYCVGIQRNVVATVRNYGNKALDSVTVNWSVNSKLQTPAKYKTKIDTVGSSGGYTAKVTLGKYLFSSSADTIEVWTSLPNGVTDTIPMNDMTFIIKKPSPPPTAAAGDDKDVCMGTKVRIGTTGVSGNKYSWTSNPAGFTAVTFNADVTPTVTTTYYLTVTATATGCSTVDSVTITVKDNPVGPTLSDKEICIGDSVRIGASKDATLTYGWTSTPAGFTSSESDPLVKPTVTTEYKLVVSNNGGCTDDTVITVTVNDLPSAFAGSDKTLCKGKSVVIGGATVSGNTYSWRSIPAGFSSNSASPSVSPADTTIYIVTVTNVSGCTKEDEVKVSISPLPVPDAGSDANICLGNSVKIGSPAQTGHTYSWTSKPAGFVSFAAEPPVSPKVTTTYILLARNSSGCTSEDSVTVTIVPAPTVEAGNPKTICAGDSVSLGAAATTDFTYSWTSLPAGFTSTDAQIKVSPGVTTTYTLMVTNAEGCSAEGDVKVTVNPIPVANAGDPKTICKGTSTQIGGPAVSGNSYNWTSDPAGFTSTDPQPNVKPNATTTYRLVVTGSNGCTAKTEVTVTVEIPPVVSFTWNYFQGHPRNVRFSPSDTDMASYTWYFPDGDTSTDLNPVYLFADPKGRYQVRLVTNDAKGCISEFTDSVILGSTGFREDIAHQLKLSIYPNPFRSGTTVSYTLQNRAQVHIILLDVTGKQVSQLVNTLLPRGEHTYVIKSGDHNLQPGIYFVQVRVDGSGTTRQIIKLE